VSEPEDDLLSPHDDPAVVAAFLDLFLQDLEGDDVRPLAHYQERLPAHAALVARHYCALVEAHEARTAEEDGGGQRIGPYRVVREVGRGGQGVVYLADDTRLKRRVALKVLEGLPLPGEPALRRFRREAEVASGLEHPGICAVFDSGVSDGVAFIAMRYIEGETLAAEIDELRRREAPPSDRGDVSAVCLVIERAAKALHAAHEAGVVHRDVKPGNLIVAPDGEPVLLDFGLARAVESEEATLTRTGDVFGTPAYMAPEQLRGKVVDLRADVYSLGATLFERLALSPPFVAPTREALFRAILDDDAPDVRDANPSLPRDLAVVVQTALEKDPDRRYRTALDLAEDLRRVREREPILARPPGPLQRAWLWSDKNRAVASLAAGLFLALGIGLGVTAKLLRRSEDARTELSQMTVELGAALADAERGRLSEKQERIELLIADGFQQAMGASVGQSAETFEEALALDPTNKTALLGRAWVETFTPLEPYAVLDRFAGELANDPDVIWMRGLAAELAGRTAEAATHYERAGDDDTHLRLYLKGLRTVENFMSFDPEKATAAVKLFRRANLQAPRPQYPYLHSLLMAASYAGDTETMEEAAAALERHWPELPGTWDAIAQFFMPIDVERAKRALHRTLALKPSAAPCCGLAYEAAGRGAVHEALEWFDKGIALEPDFAPVWYMKGALLAKQQSLEEARRCFVASLERDPHYTPAFEALYLVHVGLADPEAARADFEPIARAEPTLPNAWLSLAWLATERGELTAARDLLRRAVEADPYHGASLADWTDVLVRSDDLAQAAAEVQVIVDAHPDSYKAWLALGRVRRASGDDARALEAFERGLAIHPDEPELVRERAAVLDR
jgi:serine/threonine protein kinase/lipoprotein NlpI